MSVETIINTEPELIVQNVEGLINTIYGYIVQVIAIASLVATTVGSKSGNKYISWTKKFINILAANWGRAKNLEEERVKPAKTINNTRFTTNG